MIILAKLIGLKSEQDFWPSLQVSQVVRKVLSLVDCQDTLGRLSREFGCESVLKTLPDDILQFLTSSFLPAETRPRCEISGFCLLSFSQNENLALLSLYTF